MGNGKGNAKGMNVILWTILRIVPMMLLIRPEKNIATSIALPLITLTIRAAIGALVNQIVLVKHARIWVLTVAILQVVVVVLHLIVVLALLQVKPVVVTLFSPISAQRPVVDVLQGHPVVLELLVEQRYAIATVI